jgi:hypothetical protein
MSRRPLSCTPGCDSEQLDDSVVRRLSDTIDDYCDRADPIGPDAFVDVEQLFIDAVGAAYEHQDLGRFPSLRQTNSQEIGQFIDRVAVAVIEPDGESNYAALYGVPAPDSEGFIPVVIGFLVPDWLAPLSAHTYYHDLETAADRLGVVGPVVTGTVGCSAHGRDAFNEIGDVKPGDAALSALASHGGGR